MSKINWGELLGWTKEQLEDLRVAGFSMFREGKYDKALLFFQSLVIINPENAYDMQTLGAIYLQTGQNNQALITLERALAIDPYHEPTLLNKTKALLQLDQKKAAFEIAKLLEKSKNLAIANDAAALILSYA